MSSSVKQTTNVPALKPLEPEPLSRDIIREIAMDVGKEVAHHIKMMYPEAVAAASSTFLLSVRNTTYNSIMAAIEVTDENDIRSRLKANAAHRREINKLWKLNRRIDAIRQNRDSGLCSDCPPVGYPTDETRCGPCPRRR